MKAYKLVNSHSNIIQVKAENLGYKFRNRPELSPFILLYEDGTTRGFDDMATYEASNHQEITQADFLALPEPLKVGDWVKHRNSDGHLFIGKITNIAVNETFGNVVNIECFQSLYFSAKDCIKLSKEQIKVLGLE